MARHDSNDYDCRETLSCLVKVSWFLPAWVKAELLHVNYQPHIQAQALPLFCHPGEAYHGDLGMIENDVIFAFSNSGETPELINL